VQISHHVEIPDIDAPQSSRYSPWFVVNPFERNSIGPRLMIQSPWNLTPTIDHVFSDATIASGNQLMIAYQHFGNMHCLMTDILRPELDMEQHWVMALTQTRFAENSKAFLRVHTVIPVVTTLNITHMDTSIVQKHFNKSLPLIISDSVRGTNMDVVHTRGKSIQFLIQNLPSEIILAVYKFLVKDIMLSSPIPSIRHAIPEIWWTAPKQLLLFSDDRFFVKNPIDTITDTQGVLIPLFQVEIFNFIQGFGYCVRELYGVPFTSWDAASLFEIPTSSSLLLTGKLFTVRFKFNRTGYYLTIEPDRDVYKIHDLNLHDAEFGCVAE